MRYGLMVLMAGALAWAGCESNELQRCQGDLKVARQERAKCLTDQAAQQDITTNLLNDNKSLRDQMAGAKSDCDQRVEQARQKEQTKLQEAIVEQRKDLEGRTTALLTLQQKHKELQAEIEQLRTKLSEAEKGLKNSANMVITLQMENDKLQNRLAALEKEAQPHQPAPERKQ